MQSRLLYVIAVSGVVASAGATLAQAQTVDGGAVFKQSCANCHSGAADARAPALEALRTRAPQAVLESLMTGAMRTQGARLSGAERRAVAEFVTGKPLGGDPTGAAAGRCTATVAPPSAPAAAPMWGGWSPSPHNTRFQPADQAALTVDDLPRLTLRWAFGFPDASVAWSQPTVVGDRLFVGSQNGTVYALDRTRGCVHWTFAAAGGVRTAIVVGPGLPERLGGVPPGLPEPLGGVPPGLPERLGGVPSGTGSTAYFGDTAANVYAVDTGTGRQVWVRKVDDHPSARVTGSPTLHDGRLYVPVSSYEEAQGADPQYGCCTFRGSVSALDAKTGAVVWKTYTIPEPAKPRGTSSAGVTLWGPSGSGIWSAPTVDATRRALYVATGNGYSGPPQPSSDSVIALDLATGAIRWTRQVTPNDVYVTGCRAGNPNCPETIGPDHDFGSPPMLVRRADGKELIVIGQKSGIGFAMDPDRSGEVVWQYRAGRGGPLGGMEWGAAVDTERAYFAVSDITQPQPGGLHAVSLATGLRAWFTAPPTPPCSGRGCNAAQSAAVTAIPGVVFSGSNDGTLRAYSTATGAVVWQFDTNRDFTTVNGIPARGGSMQGPGAAVAGGMIYVNSGYGAFGGRAGNVLLAFGPGAEASKP